MMQNHDIDIVYLWCDGNEPEFKKRKNECLGINLVDLAENVSGEIRFFDNDEIKYSLRSLEMYAPWINHIYIVTDRQCPKWLNTEYEKVTVVDHSEIMPKESIPCFNSSVIEYFLHRIPNLNEKFLFSNDDMFFGAPVKPEDFFENGKPLITVRKITSFIKLKRWYFRFIGKYNKMGYKAYINILNSYDLLEKEYGKTDCYSIQHNIDSYSRSAFEATINRYAESFEACYNNKFRNHNDLERIIFGLDAIYSGAGILRETKTLGFCNKVLGVPFNGELYSYLGKEGNLEQAIKDIKKYRPKLFCINAGSDSDVKIKNKSKIFLEEMFPNPSKFEKQ